MSPRTPGCFSVSRCRLSARGRSAAGWQGRAASAVAGGEQRGVAPRARTSRASFSRSRRSFSDSRALALSAMSAETAAAAAAEVPLPAVAAAALAAASSSCSLMYSALVEVRAAARSSISCWISAACVFTSALRRSTSAIITATSASFFRMRSCGAGGGRARAVAAAAAELWASPVTNLRLRCHRLQRLALYHELELLLLLCLERQRLLLQPLCTATITVASAGREWRLTLHARPAFTVTSAAGAMWPAPHLAPQSSPSLPPCPMPAASQS